MRLLGEQRDRGHDLARLAVPALRHRLGNTVEVLMPELIPAFLSAGEVTALCVRASAGVDWKPGRQGTGYDILPLRGVEDADILGGS